MPEISVEKKILEIMEVADIVLNEWEYGFIKNVKQFPIDRLSVKQLAMINKLYDKVCESPH